MNEKRFVMRYEKYIDTVENIEYDEKWESWKIVELLNTLSEENEQLKKVFRELITSGYWDDDYLTEQDWNDLKRWIENVFEKVMMND